MTRRYYDDGLPELKSFGQNEMNEASRNKANAVARWVLFHGGSIELAGVAQQCSVAEDNADAAFSILDRLDVDALRTEHLVMTPNGDAELKPFVIDDEGRFYFYRNYLAERNIAKEILRRRAASVPSSRMDVSDLFDDASGLSADPLQCLAVQAVAGKSLMILTGGPGRGKSATVLRMLVNLQRHSATPLRVRLVAPTGKAAQRLGESVRRGIARLPAGVSADFVKDEAAYTVHRLLLDAQRAQVAIPDVVVIDEASMLDLWMLDGILQAFPLSTKIILVGDAAQLTSVGTGTVLKDLVEAFQENPLSADSPDVVTLTKNFRSTGQIDALNEFALRGEADGFAPYLVDVSSHAAMEAKLNEWATELAVDLRVASQSKVTDAETYNALRRTLTNQQVLCANREESRGAVRINLEIEKRLKSQLGIGPDVTWYVGRRVLVLANDYELGLFNGDVGICVRVGDGGFAVRFERESESEAILIPVANLPGHEAMFAMTIHKSQGSEYQKVAIVLPSTANSRLLSRQLVYTAVSRAKQRVEVWASAPVLASALDQSASRFGGLKARLMAD